MEKNEKITRLKFYAKEREELIEPVKDVIRFLKLCNQRILWDNKYQQKILFVFLINIFFIFLLFIINLYLIIYVFRFDDNKIIETKKVKCEELRVKIESIDDELHTIENSKKDKDDEIKILSE